MRSNQNLPNRQISSNNLICRQLSSSSPVPSIVEVDHQNDHHNYTKLMIEDHTQSIKVIVDHIAETNITKTIATVWEVITEVKIKI